MPITSSAKRNTATVKIWNIPHTETCRNGREIIPPISCQAADQFERANGSTYRELEIALPRELTPEQRLELVQDFVRQEAGERHAWSFAIHNPKASIEGGEQPHAHIMMSQRVNDGIERTPEQYFRRYNRQVSRAGRCEKGFRKPDSHSAKEQLRELRKPLGSSSTTNI
ncbi:MobA/MobL family protein [Salmonella enterica]|uniref:MobA/MobL family protein n=1 Tax=Salmonella enterica TaxID=28901 RepID=UPI0035679692